MLAGAEPVETVSVVGTCGGMEAQRTRNSAEQGCSTIRRPGGTESPGFALMTRAALLLVDIQYDFLDGGALAVPDGDHILPVVHTLLDKGDWSAVVASQVGIR